MVSLEFIWGRDGGICQLCQEPIASIAEATRDHILPRGAGGTNRAENLQLAHLLCNNKAGHKGQELVRGRRSSALRTPGTPPNPRRGKIVKTWPPNENSLFWISCRLRCGGYAGAIKDRPGVWHCATCDGDMTMEGPLKLS